MHKITAMSRRIRIRRVQYKMQQMQNTIKHKRELLDNLVDVTQAIEDDYINSGVPLSALLLNRIHISQRPILLNKNTFYL